MQRGHSHYCKPQIRKNKGQILWNLDQNKRGGSEIMFLLTLFNSKFNTTLMAESEEELKSLLMRVKEESEKAGLKLSIGKMKIMASGPITSWQIEEEKVEAMTDFIFLGSKITADNDCSHEIKTLTPWKESYET